MRRSDKEVTDHAQILALISSCEVCRIALHDGDYPYIVPLNFGVEEREGHINLFFHSANEGKKLDLIRANNKVAFEMDTAVEVLARENACDSSARFKSVCGTGTISFVSDDEKAWALGIIMRHYQPEGVFTFGAASLAATTVFKLTVTSVTGKQSPSSD